MTNQNYSANIKLSQGISYHLKKIISSYEKNLDQFLLDDPASVINSFTDAQKKTLDMVVNWCKRFKCVYFTQEYIADKLGVTREWVNKIIAFLCRLGLIQKTYRHMSSCLYFISSKFYDLDWTYGLRDVLPSLRFHIYSLFCRVVHTSNSKDSYLNSNLLRTRKKFMIEHLKNNKSLQEAAKLLNASELGICHLSSISNAGLEFAIQKLRNYKGKIDNPFNWFITVAKKYCYLNNLPVDSSTTENMIRLLSIDRTLNFTEQKTKSHDLINKNKIPEVEHDQRRDFLSAICNMLEGKKTFKEVVDLVHSSQK